MPSAKSDQFWNINCFGKKAKTSKQKPIVTAVLPQYYCMYAKSDKATQEVFSWPAGTRLSVLSTACEKTILAPLTFNNNNNNNNNIVQCLSSYRHVTVGGAWTWKEESPRLISGKKQNLMVSWCACTGNEHFILKERSLTHFWVLH